MQRYELIEGTSSKFWEAAVQGAELVVRFGRIGTAGQEKAKQFADASTAQREFEKLVREKTGKGYVAVDGPSAGAPKVASATVAAPPREVAVAAPAPAAAPAPGSAATPPPATPVPASLPRPTGGFRWRPEWEAALPIVRGIHVPPAPTAQPLALEQLALQGRGWGHELRVIEALAGAAGRPWQYWGNGDPGGRIRQDALAQPDPDYWLELFAQQEAGGKVPESGALLMRAAVDLHGTAFALPLAVDNWRIHFQAECAWRHPEVMAPLRHAIALADEAEHDALVRIAEGLRARGDAERKACAFLFPHRADWALGFCDVQQHWAELPLLWECALPAEAFRRLLAASNVGMRKELLAPLLLQLRLDEAGALETLRSLLARAIAEREAGWVGEILPLLTALRIPGLLQVLVASMADRKVRDALEKLAGEFPAATLACAIEHTVRTQDRAAESWTLQLAVKQPQALALALGEIDASVRAKFERALAAFAPPEAEPARVPPFLREPPWLAAGGRVQLPVLAVTPIATPERLLLDDAQRHAAMNQGRHWQGQYRDENDLPNCFGLTPSGAKAVLAGLPLPDDGVKQWQGRDAWLPALFELPPQARLPLWNSYAPKYWSRWPGDEVIWRLFLENGFTAIPGLLAYFKANPDHAARLAPHFDSPALVDLQLQSMAKGKFREAAARWVRERAPTVAMASLPVAFCERPSPERDRARHALRWLAAQGLDATLYAAAERYGADMATATRQLLGLDPLALLPAEIPKRPKWLVPAAMRRPVLADGGGALPAAAVEHVATMVAISTIDAPYAGLALAKAHCTSDSLAEFAWDLCEAWLLAGAPGKDAWALQGLGLLGDDGTARRLVPRIREWQEHGAPSRAVAALDLLAAIGSDVALMHLNAFARQAKMKPLQKRAAEMIANVAEARGLSEDELGDRLVPALGLDEDGALELDFGPRRFRLRFDETLAPFLQDAQGQRLKAIPRANKEDDAAKAKAAIERYKALRSEVEAIATLQVQRLERAMVNRRRWNANAFRLFFLEHPLMRHLAARVAWGVYEGTALAHAFRIAEDGTLADADDSLFTLPNDAQVGVPHVLDMAAPLRDALGQVFADYEIAQPFRQLGREIFALTDAERPLARLKRFEGRKVATVGLLPLLLRGWARFDVQETSVCSYARELGDGLQAELRFEPGIPIGDVKSEPVQTLGDLVLRRAVAGGRAEVVPFSTLDPLAASELLRDAELLTPARS